MCKMRPSLMDALPNDGQSKAPEVAAGPISYSEQGRRCAARRVWQQCSKNYTTALIGLLWATLSSRPAFADMGRIVVVPVIGFGLWQVLLGAITVWPKSMAGHRSGALSIYVIAVIAAWAINLFLPVDSFEDFWVVLVLPFATSVGLISYFRSRRKV
jgi:hypothetical protein